MNQEAQNMLYKATKLEEIAHALLCVPYDNTWNAVLTHLDYSHCGEQNMQVGWNIENGRGFVCSVVIKVADANFSYFTIDPSNQEYPYAYCRSYVSGLNLDEICGGGFFEDARRVVTSHKIRLEECHIVDLAKGALIDHVSFPSP